MHNIAPAVPSAAVPGAHGRMSFTVVIPCFNEARRLDRTIDAMVRFTEDRPDEVEVVFVDDGSSDDTPARLDRAAAAHGALHAVHLPSNRGKGAAIAAGVRAATGDAILFFDADLSYPLTAIDTALAHLRDGADLVIGGRDLAAEADGGYSPLRNLSSAGFNLLVEQTLALGIPDTQCGFKAFDARVARALFSQLSIERFGFDVEVLFLARRWGLRIVRMPVEMTHASGSSVRIVRDSWLMFRDILRIRRNAARNVYPRTMPELDG